jgi:3-hydroxyacyl-[acyl-carrier-protein] dehydratase
MLECADIRRLLPHGHPMTLVDRVLSIDPGRSIVAVKAITVSELCFQEAGPGDPPHRYFYPASLLLESFGQAAALLWLYELAPGALEDGSVLMLVAGRDCELEGHVLPGDTLRHVARIDQIVGDNVFVTGETYVEERRVASIGSMMAVMRPRMEHGGSRPRAD